MINTWIIKAMGLSLTTQAIAVPVVAMEAAPQIAPELDDLNFFAREWQCKAEESRTPWTWTIQRDLKRIWFIGQAATAEGAVFERETLGYNTIMRQFGRTIIGDNGKFANFLSGGWEDNTWIWEGRVANMVTQQVAKHQIKLQKQSETAFSEREYKAGDTPDSWVLVSQKNCVATGTP